MVTINEYIFCYLMRLPYFLSTNATNEFQPKDKQTVVAAIK